jgi:hypothetical protein
MAFRDDEAARICAAEMSSCSTRGISLIVRSENDMIKFGGYNIFPMDIERVLQDHLAEPSLPFRSRQYMRYALSPLASAE